MPYTSSEELNFSLYGDQQEFLDVISPLLKEFSKQSQIKVNATQMSLIEAWPQLFQYVLYGGGPDVSRIGSIWTSSLVSLAALRPFTDSEVANLGGTESFFPCTWQSSVLHGDARIWAIPFTTFNYVMFYRRDLLKKAGIDEATAFTSAQAVLETLQRLQASGVQSPWVIPSGGHHRARLHIAANWLWGAGGHIFSEDGRHILINQAEAITGLKNFFELYRYLSPNDYGLTGSDCLLRFAQGRAATIIRGPDTAIRIKELKPAPEVLKNLGASSLPGIPWIGGSSLVIWKDLLANPLKERAALELIAFLCRPSTQVQLYRTSNLMPSRPEALAELQTDPPELLQIEKKALETGRSYQPFPIWVRIQNDLTQALDAITAEILSNSHTDIAAAIHHHLDPLVRRYEMILEGYR